MNVVAAHPTRLTHLFATPAAGSVALPPLDAGDQGLSAAEAPHGDRLIAALLIARGTEFVATVRDGIYELHGREGVLRYRRFRQPDGSHAYVLVEQRGRPPIDAVDARALATLEHEVMAAGGPRRPVRTEATSYPEILRRIAQLFDHRNAPDLVYIPSGGGDADTPRRAGGSHGTPDVSQSRAPLIVAGPGIVRGARSDAVVHLTDIAPTVAQFLGVAPVAPAPAATGGGTHYLRWQDGTSFASAIADARDGAGAVAQRALIVTLDGTSHTMLHDELAKGHLPNIKRLADAGVSFDFGAMAEYPTVTWANHNTITTGAEPGHHGVLNNKWYDRERRVVHDALGNGVRSTFFTAGKLDTDVETLYEAVHRTFGDGVVTAAINQPSGRGASVATLEAKGLRRIAWNLPGAWRRVNEGKALLDPRFDDGGVFAKSARFDNIGTSLLAELYDDRRDPKLAVIELFLTDGAAHRTGPQSATSRAALRQADRHLGRLLDTLQREGKLDSTMVVVTADHGSEHQAIKLSHGWKEAIAASGVKADDLGRFIYIKSLRVGDAGSDAIQLRLRVVDDDVDTDGRQRPVAGAKVVAIDAAGRELHGVTGTDGSAVLDRSAVAPGPLTVRVEHPDFTPQSFTAPGVK